MAAAALLGLWLSVAGCASIRVTDPARTATEQFLLSQAAEKAVGQLAFQTLRGRRVWVDIQYFAASEQAFVLGELRARLLLAGVQLVPEREQSDIVFEVRSGGVGIDRYDFLLGVPSLTLGAAGPSGAGATPTSPPLSTPELALLKNTYQKGVASVAYVAYWRETGEVVGSSGPYVGRTFRDDWWFFGWGPRTSGDIVTTEPEEPKVKDAPEPEPVPAGTAPPP